MAARKPIIGALSDTHDDDANATPHVIDELEKRGADIMIHCGDAYPEQVNSGAYGRHKFYCAITQEQVADFKTGCPLRGLGWDFTYPDDRIRDLGDGLRVYLGHKKTSLSSFNESQLEILQKIEKVRTENHNTRWMFVGHTHRQKYFGRGLITLINPGAVEVRPGIPTGAIGGHAFATLDTETGKATFSRIQNPVPKKQQVTIGIISDTLDVTEMDETFWPKLAEVFKEEGVTHIIHCGNINKSDVGVPALNDFIKVYYHLRSDQGDIKEACPNWEPISRDSNMVEICGYNFYVNPNLGNELYGENEKQIYFYSVEVLAKYPETHLILGGSSAYPFYEEHERTSFILPGYAGKFKRFVIVKLPRYEITIHSILPDPLPPLDVSLLNR